ncbi:hypothetical protein LOAG_10939 [Loa loa]|nr:hypothetical protein LOAG_10939 [Loa loa]EFO17557.1 hypothetical protein LOAG_10939 [Loa loa]
MEHEIDELENEDWIRGDDINNHDLSENFHFNSSINDRLDNIAGSSQQNDNFSRNVILNDCQQLSQHNFYDEEIDNESYERFNYLERLSVGSSRSSSPRFMRESQERHFNEYPRYNYPNTAQNFIYPQMDDELNDDEMNSLTNHLRMGLTIYDQSSPISAPINSREFALQQSSNYCLSIDDNRFRERYGSNRSIFSEEENSIQSCRHMSRSFNRSLGVSIKRRHSLPLIAKRQIRFGYITSSESDEELMDDVSYSNHTIKRNYPLRSRIDLRSLRINRGHLLRTGNLHRRQRSSQKYPRSRLYGRLHRVDSGRIRRRRF